MIIGEVSLVDVDKSKGGEGEELGDGVEVKLIDKQEDKSGGSGIEEADKFEVRVTIETIMELD